LCEIKELMWFESRMVIVEPEGRLIGIAEEVYDVEEEGVDGVLRPFLIN